MEMGSQNGKVIDAEGGVGLQASVWIESGDTIDEPYAEQKWYEVEEMLEDRLLRGEDKSLAIHRAVEYGHPHLVVDNYKEHTKGLDFDTLISLHTLHLAAEAGNDKVVSLLVKECHMSNLEKLHELINGTDGKGWTPLYWACQNGHVRVAEVLLNSNWHNPLEFPGLINEEFTTPLHLAIKPSRKEEIPLSVMDKSEQRSRVALVKALLESPEGMDLLNKKDGQGRTPLHLAVETMNVDVVELLIKQPRLIATGTDRRGKTPSGLVWDQLHSDQTKGLESVKIMQKYLMTLHDVREEHTASVDGRARYYNAANNLLVGGALLVQVAFSGMLSMPVLFDEFLTEVCPDSLAPSPGLSSDSAPAPGLAPSSGQCIDRPTHVKDVMQYKTFYVRAIDVFRASNNLTFYFAIITIIAALRIIISRRSNIPLEREISHLRTSTLLTSLSLTFSTVYAVAAFISGGLAKVPVPESGWGYVIKQWVDGKPEVIFKSTSLTTTMVGLILVIPFILVPLVGDDLALFRSYLNSKLGDWDTHHSQWAIGSWRPFFALAISILFLVCTIVIMFMLIFGVGLLTDYVRSPPTD